MTHLRYEEPEKSMVTNALFLEEVSVTATNATRKAVRMSSR
jgi:hypothetical protein